MAGEVSCTVCGRTFALADVAPGQVARCPYCQMKVELPAAPPPEETPGTAWYVYTFEGERYGPIGKEELDEWVRESRLTADCQVLQEGWTQWRWARDVFPELRAGMSLHKPVSTAPSRPATGGNYAGPGPEPHPYAAPQAPTGPPAGISVPEQWQVPHRGGLILTLGILSFFFSCLLFGLPAWIMGQSDLKEMRQGRMDPSGEGLTIAGLILGIIGTLFSAIVLLVFFVACAGGMALGP